MAENRNLLISKRSVYSVIKSGNLPENADRNEKSNDKLYISVSNKDSLETTSPLGNISVFRVVDTLNDWSSYSADDVKHYADMQKNGELPEGVKVEKQSSEEFLEEQFKDQEMSFKKAIQPRDNSCLGIVISYINKAMDENNQELLGMMEELIKHDPNFEFLFRDGKLSRQVVNAFREQSNGELEYMMDTGEELEEETGGKFDASKASFGELDKIADTPMDELIQESSEEIIIDNAQVQEVEDESKEDKQQEEEQKLEDSASEKKQNILNRIARMMLRVNLIKNVAARRRAQIAIEDGQKKSEQALSSKVKSGLAKLSGLIRGNGVKENVAEDRDNNSLANIFKRSRLSNEATNKDTETNQSENEREKLRQERELQKAKEKADKGRKLTNYEQELLDKDREERIRKADEAMIRNSTIGNIEVKDKNINEKLMAVAQEAKARIELGKETQVEQKTNETPDKDDEGR